MLVIYLESGSKYIPMGLGIEIRIHTIFCYTQKSLCRA